MFTARKNRGVAIVMVVVGVVAAIWANTTAAGGKKDAPPPPPGTIYYLLSGSEAAIWGMKADGSDKFLELPISLLNEPGIEMEGTPQPSQRVYDGSRWWLTIRRFGQGRIDLISGLPWTELYAFRPVVQADGSPGVQWVQLTDLYPDVLPIGHPSFTRWSNDADDSFVSFIGIDQSDGSESLYRINLSFDLIEEAADAGYWTPLQLGDPVLEQAISGTPVARLGTAGDWSPDGTQAAMFDIHGLRVWPVGASEPHWLSTTALYGSWSPDGLEIACTDQDEDRNPQLLTVAPNGVFQRILLSGVAYREFYAMPCWSPDSEHLVFRYGKWGTGAGTRDYIYRIPAAGGRVVNLTKDLDPDRTKTLLGWVPDTAAE